MDKPTLIRPLGHTEQLCYLHQDGFAVVYATLLSSTIKIEDSHIMTSMKCLQEIFPLLKMIVVESNGEKWFTESNTGDVDYSRVEGDWRDVCDKMNNMRFDKEKGPYWRVCLVERACDRGENQAFKYAVICNIFHVITDGLTSIKMCGQFSDIIDATMAGETVTCPPHEVKPPLEELLTKDYSWSEIKPLLLEALVTKPLTSGWTKAVGGNGFEIYLNGKLPTLTFLILKAESDADGAFIGYADCLDEQDTKRFIARCKLQGVSVNSAVTTALNCSLFNQLTIVGKVIEEPVNISAFHTVSLRRFLENGDDIAGLYFGCAFTSSPVTNNTKQEFWDRSKEIHNSVHEQLSNENYVKKISTVNTVINGGKPALTIPFITTDIMTSNLGNVDRFFSRDLEFLCIERVCRLQNMRCAFSGPVFVAFHTLRSKLDVTVTYLPKFISKKQVASIGEETIALLKHASTD